MKHEEPVAHWYLLAKMTPVPTSFGGNGAEARPHLLLPISVSLFRFSCVRQELQYSDHLQLTGSAWKLSAGAFYLLFRERQLGAVP
jgi:hypothetical protein